MAKGSHGGKGSKPRPIQDKEAFDRNWDRIFGSRTENGRSSNDRKIHASPESGLVERMEGER